MSEHFHDTTLQFIDRLEGMTEAERLDHYIKLDGRTQQLTTHLLYARYTLSLRKQLEEARMEARLIEGHWLSEIMNQTVNLDLVRHYL